MIAESSESRGTSIANSGKIGVSIPALLNADATGQYVTTDSETETRTLHDYMFNLTESRLLELDRILVIPGELGPSDWIAKIESGELSSISYVLVRGRVTINDFDYMRTMMDNFIELAKVIKNLTGESVFANQPTGSSRASRSNNDHNTEIQNMKKQVDGLQKVFDVFVGDRLAVRAIPYATNPELRLVGPLRPNYLRDQMSDIRYKYGTSPRSDWSVFAQIASIPSPNLVDPSLALTFGNQMDQALESILGAMREIERGFQISYPEIAITPIAIYRD